MASNTTYIESHILNRFNIIKKIGSGAYGHVWKVQQKQTKKVFALKKIFDAFQHATDAQRTYREIQILRQLNHPNIIRLHERIKAVSNKDVYLIFEYMQADLHNVIGQNLLKDIHIRFIIYQLAKALKYLHSGKVIHRDLKPSNILINSDCSIKLCDFGLVRSLKTMDQGNILTQGVATRWYRSPQVLLGSKSYSTPADIWSFGCIIYQILLQGPLFQGNSTMDQLEKICSLIGHPSEEDFDSIEGQLSKSLIKEMKITNHNKITNSIRQFDPLYKNLLDKMLIFNPKKRITIDEILKHELVKSFHKPSQEIVLLKEITTPIDDNKKISVDQYKRLVYGQKPILMPKTKNLSSSLGAGSVSPKYLPSNNINKSITNYQPYYKKEFNQGSKKTSLQNLMNMTEVNSEERKSYATYKPEIKHEIKNVRSAINFAKNSNVQNPVNQNLKYYRRQYNPNQTQFDSMYSKISQSNPQNKDASKKLDEKVKFQPFLPRKNTIQHQNVVTNHQPKVHASFNPSNIPSNKMFLSEQQIKQKLLKFKSFKNQNPIKFTPNEHLNKSQMPANFINFKTKPTQ